MARGLSEFKSKFWVSLLAVFCCDEELTGTGQDGIFNLTGCIGINIGIFPAIACAVLFKDCRLKRICAQIRIENIDIGFETLNRRSALFHS